MLLILAFASDLTRLRFPFIALGFLFTLIGFIIYVSIDVKTKLNVAYFACFMSKFLLRYATRDNCSSYLSGQRPPDSASSLLSQT
jgi:hypothetical protein